MMWHCSRWPVLGPVSGASSARRCESVTTQNITASWRRTRAPLCALLTPDITHYSLRLRKACVWLADFLCKYLLNDWLINIEDVIIYSVSCICGQMRTPLPTGVPLQADLRDFFRLLLQKVVITHYLKTVTSRTLIYYGVILFGLFLSASHIECNDRNCFSCQILFQADPL